jgi:hypothetical protein
MDMIVNVIVAKGLQKLSYTTFLTDSRAKQAP